jgi:hypothetical protein
MVGMVGVKNILTFGVKVVTRNRGRVSCTLEGRRRAPAKGALDIFPASGRAKAAGRWPVAKCSFAGTGP